MSISDLPKMLPFILWGLLLFGIVLVCSFLGYKIGRRKGLLLGTLIGMVVYVQLCEMLRAHYPQPGTDKSSAIFYLLFLWPYLAMMGQNNI